MPGFMSAPTDRYLKLISQQPLRPIRTDSDLDIASEIAGRLALRSNLSADEKNYLEVLSALIEAYEDEHCRIPEASGSDVLRMLIESNGYSQAEVARLTGFGESTISEILSGRRPMNVRHMKAFAALFRVAPALFSDPNPPRNDDL